MDKLAKYYLLNLAGTSLSKLLMDKLAKYYKFKFSRN